MALSDTGLVFRYGLSESSFTQFDDSGANAAHLDSNAAGTVLTAAGTTPHKYVHCSTDGGVGHLARYLADSGDAIRTALEGKKKITMVMKLRWGTVADDRTLWALNQWSASYGDSRLAMSFRANKLMPRWLDGDCTYANIDRIASGDTVFGLYTFHLNTDAANRLTMWADTTQTGTSNSGVTAGSTLTLPVDMQISLFGSEGDVSGWSGNAPQADIAYFALYVDQDWDTTRQTAEYDALVIDDDAFGGGAQTLEPSLLTRSKTIYAPTVTGGLVTLSPSLLTRSKTIYAPSVTGGAVTAKTYLDFQPNGEVDSMARIEWPNDATTLRKSSTFIFEHIPNSGQVGYGANVWFSLEGWTTTDDKGWSVGFHPAYPCDLTYDSTGQRLVGGGSSGTTHCPEIAGNGALDIIANSGSSGTAIATDKGVPRIYAAVITSSGGTTTHTLYRNLPSVDAADKFTFSRPTSEIDAYTPTGAKMRYGSSPWTDNSPFSGRNDETAEGKSRFFKVFSTPLSETDLALEAVEPSNTPVTSAGIASVYYTNVNPTSTDITDKSGQGNDPSWANAQRPVDYSVQVVTAPLLTRTKTIFAPSVSQEGVTLSPSLLTHSKTIYAPSVSVGGVTLSPALLTRSKTLYVPTVSQTGAPQILAPGLLTRSKVLYSPVVVPGEVSVAPTLLTRTKVLYAPTISTGYGITAPLLTRSKTLYSPTITVGGVTLTPPLLTRSKTLYFPTLTGGDTPVATGGVFWPTVRRRRR